MSNLINLSGLTDRDLDALLDVAADEDGASLEGLSANGQLAVEQAFAVKGIKVPSYYWDDVKPSPAAATATDYEDLILSRQVENY